MDQTKTDNSYLGDKVYLRANHLPNDDIILLDAYAGLGHIWQGVSNVTGRKINRLAIDKKRTIGFHLPGDNLAYLPSMDLTRFNAIDLDAYGVPYPQIEIVFQSKFSGWVYVTFIQSIFGGLPTDFLVQCGFTKAMIKKSPSLVYRRGFEYFLEYLASRGVEKVFHRSVSRKHYVAMFVNGAVEHAKDSDIQ